MLKRSVTFKDLEGNERTEDFYFNLNMKEVVAMELSGEGNSFLDQVQRIVASGDGKTIIETFQNIILTAYGERNVDGINFDKNNLLTGAPLRYKFEGHPAYSALFVELSTDADAGADFVNGIMPDDIAEQMQKFAGTHDSGTVVDANASAPVAPPTREQYLAMSDEEFVAAVGDDPKKMTPEQLMVAYQRKNQS